MTVYMDACFQMSGITSTSCVGEVGEFGGWDNSIIIRLIDKNVDKSIGKPCRYTQLIRKTPYLFYYQVLWESISGTTSHVCYKCEDLYDKIIIVIVPSYTGKILLVGLCWHCYSCCTLQTCDIFTIALYYGDT